jgi:hypothetical protein
VAEVDYLKEDADHGSGGRRRDERIGGVDLPLPLPSAVSKAAERCAAGVGMATGSVWVR